jgi:ankyrin repeat protein
MLRRGDPLWDAVWKNQYEEVSRLLDAGANPNDVMIEDVGSIDHGSPLLHVAVLMGSYATALSLIAHGACVNSLDDRGYSPLLQACTNPASVGSAKTIEALVAAGAEVSIPFPPSLFLRGHVADKSALDLAAHHTQVAFRRADQQANSETLDTAQAMLKAVQALINAGAKTTSRASQVSLTKVLARGPYVRGLPG